MTKAKEAIILLSHGSKSTKAQEELKSLAFHLAENRQELVKVANLQFVDLNFWDIIDRLISEGINKIVIIPLFVFAGRHVKKDIPELILQAKGRYPQIEFKVTSHLAAQGGLRRVIEQKLTE